MGEFILRPFSDSMTMEDINEILRQSWSRKGVEAWWDRPRHQLGRKTPRQVWEAGWKRRVYDLAVSGLAQVGT